MLYNAVVTVNSVDLTTRVKSISWNGSIDKQPAASMGDAESYSMPGVRDVGDITMEFFQDYAASNVYITLKALWAAQSTFVLTAKADSASDSATNPNFTCTVFVSKMPMINGSRGDAHMAPVTFTTAGIMTFDLV